MFRIDRNRLCRVACVLTLAGAVSQMASSAAAEACSFALRPSTATLEPLKKAIQTVNGGLDDPSSKLMIVGEGDIGGAVPVYMVRPSEARRMVAHVREGCRAILVGSTEFEKAFPKLDAPGDEEEMLALLLLHELGHIRSGHYGRFLPSDAVPSLNLDETDSKKREEEADAFAASVIREEYEALTRGDGHIPTAMLMTFVSRLSFSISTKASLSCFGCRVLGSPDIFWDHSQSHENLEYRLLKMNHAIAPSDVTSRLLEEYERRRDESR